MIHPQALIKLFGYNFELIHKQTVGMTHAESLIRPPCDGNCLNWLLGHIISARTFPLNYVGEEPVWTDTQRARYRNGASPILSDGEDVLRLDELLGVLSLSQERLIGALQRMNYDDMCRPTGYRDNTLGDSLGYFQFHEAQHVGQILHLAQLLGKDSVWIS